MLKLTFSSLECNKEQLNIKNANEHARFSFVPGNNLKSCFLCQIVNFCPLQTPKKRGNPSYVRHLLLSSILYT